ncbi:hypothetical protein BJX99DRAFT_229232 [Aspergillus californicus]
MGPSSICLIYGRLFLEYLRHHYLRWYSWLLILEFQVSCYSGSPILTYFQDRLSLFFAQVNLEGPVLYLGTTFLRPWDALVHN